MTPTQAGVMPSPGEVSHRHLAADGSGTSSENEEELEGKYVTKGKWMAKQRKSKRVSRTKGSTENSSSSGESSDMDSAHRDGSYWKVGAKIPGLAS